jgi:hypothetical protein
MHMQQTLFFICCFSDFQFVHSHLAWQHPLLPQIFSAYARCVGRFQRKDAITHDLPSSTALDRVVVLPEIDCARLFSTLHFDFGMAFA